MAASKNLLILAAVAGTGTTLLVLKWLKSIKLDPPAKHCSCPNRLRGKFVVVTGATSGMGYEVALQAAQREATVIFGCRSFEKGIETRDKIRRISNNANVHFFLLDLISFQSCKTFAESVISFTPRVDYLVNNAGIFNQPHKLTKDGIEQHWQTNFYGHVVITEILIPFIMRENILFRNVTKATKGVVFVTSEARTNCTNDNILDLKIEDVKVVKSSSDFMENFSRYALTKKMLWLYSLNLASRVKNNKIALKVSNVDPGSTYTGIFSNTFKDYLTKLKCHLRMRTPYEASQTALHCLLMKPYDTEAGGQVYKDCEVIEVPTEKDYFAADQAMKKFLPVVQQHISYGIDKNE